MTIGEEGKMKIYVWNGSSAIYSTNDYTRKLSNLHTVEEIGRWGYATAQFINIGNTETNLVPGNFVMMTYGISNDMYTFVIPFKARITKTKHSMGKICDVDLIYSLGGGVPGGIDSKKDATTEIVAPKGRVDGNIVDMLWSE